jgi:hypothetical protein
MTIQREFTDPFHRAAYVAGLRTGAAVVGDFITYPADVLRLKFGEMTAAEIRLLRSIGAERARAIVALAAEIEAGK